VPIYLRGIVPKCNTAILGCFIFTIFLNSKCIECHMVGFGEKSWLQNIFHLWRHVNLAHSVSRFWDLKSRYCDVSPEPFWISDKPFTTLWKIRLIQDYNSRPPEHEARALNTRSFSASYWIQNVFVEIML